MAKSLLARAVEAIGPDILYASMTDEQRNRLRYEWEAWARPEQLQPQGAWHAWLILAGRGFGKTRCGAEWVRGEIESGRRQRLALVAPTAADARDVMVEGQSGILACSPPWCRPNYEPSKRRLTWPNGGVATVFTADEPERLRGPQFDGAWVDELAAWRYPDAWDMLQLGLRLGGDPRVVATTTPKPTRIIRELVKAPSTVVTRGSTYDNAPNLAPTFLAAIRARYEGTRLGRQELYAEVLDDVQGALWSHGLIERYRIRLGEAPQAFKRVVVAVDPSGSAKAEADEAGIVVAATAPCACKQREELHAFVLDDLSGKFSPHDMGHRAVGAYWKYQADRLVAEDNFGGQIIADLIHLIDKRVAYRAVRASRGKIVRAEPIAALYEQGRVHHIGLFDKLEDEMCSYTPLSPTSPGRMDSVAWALTDLMLDSQPPTYDDEPGWRPAKRRM